MKAIDSHPDKQDLIHTEIQVYLSNSYVSPSSGLKGLPSRSQLDAVAETANAVTNCNKDGKAIIRLELQIYM